MMLPLLVFLFVAGSIVGGYFAITILPDKFAARELDRRLRDVGTGAGEVESESTHAHVHVYTSTLVYNL